MKRIFITIFILAIFVVTGIQNINGQVNARLETEIGKVLRDYYEAFSRRDVATTSLIYADDGFAYSPESGYETNKQVKEEIRTYLLSPMAKNFKDLYEIEDLKVVSVTADTAIANYTVITKSEQNGKIDVRRDRSTNVFVRRNGRWQIIADHTSQLPNSIEPIISGLPVGWQRAPANSSNSYSITVDASLKHDGKASATIKSTCGDENGFGSLSQLISADDYHGRRVRLSGWLKSENAKAAGLWMRVDGNRRLLGFDNMLNRAVSGTTDWKRYEVVLDVPPEAVNIFFGTLIDGKGQVWVDDFKLEIVGNDVSTTNQLSPEQMRLDNPNRNQKKYDRKQPINLGFENGTIP